MYNFQLTKYYNVDSIIHNLNPLNKIICIILFTIMMFISNDILSLMLLLIFIAILVGMSNVDIIIYLKNYKYLIPFILFIFLIDLIFSNIETSIILILKILLFISYFTLLLYTTKLNDLIYGLERFLKPLKIFGVDVNALSLKISLAIKFIPTMFIEGEKVYKSSISRGLNFNGNLKEKYTKIMSFIITTFNMSLKRNQTISNALDIKMYNSNNKRTKYKLDTFSFIDENILLFHIFMLLVLILKKLL